MSELNDNLLDLLNFKALLRSSTSGLPSRFLFLSSVRLFFCLNCLLEQSFKAREAESAVGGHSNSNAVLRSDQG